MYVFIISVHGFAQKFPFEISSDKINENTKWYYIKINNNYIGVDQQQKLYVMNSVKGNKYKYYWAFIDAGKESFYLVNRFLGLSYRLDSYSSSSVIQNGDLAVMKQGAGRKMHYKLAKNGGAGIYTKSMLNTYLGTDNSRVGFVTSAQKADIIVDFAKSESEVIKEIEAEENRIAEETRIKAEEQRKIEEQKRIEEKRKNEKIALRKVGLKKRNGQWINLTSDVEGYGYIKKVRVKTNSPSKSTSNCNVFFVTYYENEPTYLVLNTNSWIVYIDGDEYKELNKFPKKDGWVEFDFQSLTQPYTLKDVETSYLGSRIRNRTSLSQPLNEFMVEIFIVPLFIQK